MLLLENYNLDDPIIISSGEEVSIKSLVDVIVDVVGFKGSVIFDSHKPDGQYRKPSDNKPLRSIVGELNLISLPEGIKKTYDWFIKNNQKARI